MKLKLKLLTVLFTSAMAFAQGEKKPTDGIFAEIETSKGKIVLELEYKKTPVTVANFVSLAEGNNPKVAERFKGKPFYDGLKFHRVIADFMIQGGDPNGNGSGDPGYKFKDEITDLKHTGPGILSMANSGPATNGSQFFITHKKTEWLDGKHTVFGHVVSGQDVVNAIAQDDVITKMTIVRKGAEAKKFNAPKVFEDYFAQKAIEEKRKADEAAAAKKAAEEKMAPIKKNKVAYLEKIRKEATTLESGVAYKIVEKGNGAKPADGSVYSVYYAGYLEDGTLFDASLAEVNAEYGITNPPSNNQPFPFTAGKKDGLIKGFIEGLEQMSLGDRAIVFIPSALGYGARGAGNVIPPNSDLIFEIKMTEPEKK